MDIIYKLVSDWNLKADFSVSTDTKGITPIAEDPLFSTSTNGGSYHIAVDSSNVRHGVFAKSSTYVLHYFTYTNNVVTLEKIEVDEQEIKGQNPRLSFKSNGNPVILYYDLNTLSISALESDGSLWSRSAIDYVNMDLPLNKRQIDVKNDSGKVYGAYIYSFDNEQSVIQYVHYNGTNWTSETVASDVAGSRFKSVAFVLDPSDNFFIFAGTTSGIEVYDKARGKWRLERNYSESLPVYEIDAECEVVKGYSHIAYLCGTEVRYQRYDHTLARALNRFLIKDKFIDFNASSVSISVDAEYNPLVSYSHVEEDIPLQVFLRIARGTEYGDSFKTYIIDSSSSASYVGYLSDVVYDQNDKICILYYNEGVKLYDEQKDIDEDNISTTSWKDRTFTNNLTASSSPPSRDSQNTYMEFTSSSQQCFYIPNANVTDLDESTTAFSILFTIIPKGVDVSAQTIVSKSSDEEGYEIFLGGSQGLTLGFTLHTIYSSLNTLVVDLPKGEPSKVGFVYSGYDVKIYVKTPQNDNFSVYKYDIFGDVKKTSNPFVIGAYGVRNDGETSPYYPYPTAEETYTFSNYLDARLVSLKYWKRELSYAEASYSDTDIVVYDSSIDPYSDNIDYTTYKSSSGTRHFSTHGDALGVVDYGGIDKINLMSYSNFDAEDRVTNSTGYSVDPFVVKKSLGGMALIWADKQSGYSEIYVNDFNSNHSTKYLSSRNSRLRSYGRNGKVVANTNTFVDPKANFYKNGVFVGDFLCITSGQDYVGRRIPVVNVLSSTCVEVGAYFSKTSGGLGYYIDSTSSHRGNDTPVRVTRLLQSSVAPVAVSDSLNDLHIVWQSLVDEYYEIYYQRYRPKNSVNQIWGSVQLTNKEGNATSPSLAIDSEDVLHLVWEDSRSKNPHSIMYGRSSETSSDANLNFVKWSTSNFEGEDIVLSGNLYAEDPNIAVDRDDVSHVVFSARISSSDDSKYEIYYCNNQKSVFTNPIRITEFNKRARNPVVILDKDMNRYIFFSCKRTINEEVYMVKYDCSSGEWKQPRRISFSDADSIMPDVSIDSDGIIYVYWIDKTSSSDSVGFAKYNTALDRVSAGEARPSSSPADVLKISTAMDESKTTYFAWEDGRLGSNVGTEIYKNELVNLINFDELEEEAEEETKTDAEVVADQLNKFVIGKKYSDDISPSELPLSDEALGDVVLTLETTRSSYTVPVDLFNSENPLATQETIVLDSRDVTIKIKGLPRTLAYRIKNIDDPAATYSEFYEFTIDVFPDTTVGNWRLSPSNGAKTLGIQLYTFQGLVSPIAVDLYLNEPDIYEILFFNDEGDTIGESVDTEYQSVKALSFNTYWVKIKPYKVVDSNQVVKFDVITQGNDINNVPTTFDGEYHVGKFSVNVHDGVRYIDGSAKIIPKIVAK